MLGRKVIYVRCIKCSYNNVPKGIRLLDKKHFCLYRKKFMQVRAFERYVSLPSVSTFNKSSDNYAIGHIITKMIGTGLYCGNNFLNTLYI